jgi:hypothetical protein
VEVVDTTIEELVRKLESLGSDTGNDLIDGRAEYLVKILESATTRPSVAQVSRCERRYVKLDIGNSAPVFKSQT